MEKIYKELEDLKTFLTFWYCIECQTKIYQSLLYSLNSKQYKQSTSIKAATSYLSLYLTHTYSLNNVKGFCDITKITFCL